jgi:hypothetical protein
MTDIQVAETLVRFLNSVGLHEGATLIRKTSLDVHSPCWGATGATFINEDEPEPRHVIEARIRAKEWCEAKNRNVRPVRPQDMSNPSVREGQEAALEWLKRKTKSAIRKR